MPLQYPNQSPYNPYVEPQRPVNWPKIILLSLTALVIVLVVGYFIMNGAGKNGSDNKGIAVGEPNPNGINCTSDVYNCANFTTQAAAQVVFDFCFKASGDVHGLDADGNGKACEGLR